jgi:hypothetical protein
MLKRFLPVVLVPVLLAGCATTMRLQTTNLTPLQQPRTTNNLYTVEVAVASRQETLRWDSIQPTIVSGGKTYPMHKTLLMTNRWEGSIEVPPGVKTVKYRYKFDFLCNAFGPAKADSKLTDEYVLKISE